MRNPSAYVSKILNAQICCILIMILCASLVLGLGFARTMLMFERIKLIIFAKIFDFKFSHRRESTRRESTRRGGVANFTGAAASGGGVHPCSAVKHDRGSLNKRTEHGETQLVLPVFLNHSSEIDFFHADSEIPHMR